MDGIHTAALVDYMAKSLESRAVIATTHLVGRELDNALVLGPVCVGVGDIASLTHEVLQVLQS